MANLFQYADDLRILVIGRTVESVRERASNAYKVMQYWFMRNKLKLNNQKTHFMFMMTRQRAAGKSLQDLVDFGGETVAPSKSEKILGITIESNMSMHAHLVGGESSVLMQISKKMRALWLLKSHLTFKSRKMTAWGLVMSKLLYGIEVWGPHASDKQISQMQVIQNLIMRWICAAKRGTRTRDLLRMTGMMSMRQLVMYRVLMAGLTASWNGTPAAMSTRKEEPVRRLQLTTRSFRFYFSKLYQRIPDSILMKDPKKEQIRNKEVDL